MTSGQTKTRAALWLAAVFVAGTVLGAAATRFHSAHWDGRGRPTGLEYRSRALNSLTESLGLDARQQEQVETILDELGERFRLVREAIEPEMDAIRTEGDERIMALLDARQRAEYEVMLVERDEWLQRRATRFGYGNRGNPNRR